MKNKKIIIISTILVLLVLGLVAILYFKPYKNLSSGNKNIIGEQDITKTSYGHPLISLLYYNDNTLNVEAGIYRFGDIDQDGVVGNNDIEALKIMISTDKVGFTDGQVKLADVNEDSIINNSDVELFNQYLNNNGNVEYSISSNLLSYCITLKKDSSTCTWQNSSKFKITEKKDYYVFVKQNNNNRISEAMLFSKETMEEVNI